MRSDGLPGIAIFAEEKQWKYQATTSFYKYRPTHTHRACAYGLWGMGCVYGSPYRDYAILSGGPDDLECSLLFLGKNSIPLRIPLRDGGVGVVMVRRP